MLNSELTAHFLMAIGQESETQVSVFKNDSEMHK